MEYMSYPGGKVPFTAALSLAPERPAPLPCYRTMDETGDPVEGAEVPHPLGEELAVAMYRCMVLVQTMDTVFYEAQRQGRFPFYMTSTGEEASCIGTSAALQPEDAIFAQYREQGALLWRGMTVQDMAHQRWWGPL